VNVERSLPSFGGWNVSNVAPTIPQWNQFSYGSNVLPFAGGNKWGESPFKSQLGGVFPHHQLIAIICEVIKKIVAKKSFYGPVGSGGYGKSNLFGSSGVDPIKKYIKCLTGSSGVDPIKKYIKCLIGTSGVDPIKKYIKCLTGASGVDPITKKYIKCLTGSSGVDPITKKYIKCLTGSSGVDPITKKVIKSLTGSGGWGKNKFGGSKKMGWKSDPWNSSLGVSSLIGYPGLDPLSKKLLKSCDLPLTKLWKSDITSFGKDDLIKKHLKKKLKKSLWKSPSSLLF